MRILKRKILLLFTLAFAFGFYGKASAARDLSEEPIVACALETASKKDGLKDIAKPHVGFYECKKMLLGRKNVLKEFKDVTAELTADGELIVRYHAKSGEKGEYDCNYQYDAVTGELKLSKCKELGGAKNKATLKDGKLNVFVRFGRTNLVMTFEQK